MRPLADWVSAERTSRMVSAGSAAASRRVRRPRRGPSAAGGRKDAAQPFRDHPGDERDADQHQAVAAKRREGLEDFVDRVPEQPAQGDGDARPQQRADRVEQQELPVAQADRPGDRRRHRRESGTNSAKIMTRTQRARSIRCAQRTNRGQREAAQRAQDADAVAAAGEAATACRLQRRDDGDREQRDRRCRYCARSAPATMSVGYAGTGTPACSTKTLSRPGRGRIPGSGR